MRKTTSQAPHVTQVSLSSSQVRDPIRCRDLCLLSELVVNDLFESTGMPLTRFESKPPAGRQRSKAKQAERLLTTTRVAAESLRAVGAAPVASSSRDLSAKGKRKKLKKGSKKEENLRGQLKAAVEGLTRAHQYLAEERTRLLTESRESQPSPYPIESGLDSDRRSHDYNWKIDKIEELGQSPSHKYEDVIYHLKQEVETRGAEFEALRSDISSRLLSYENLLGRIEAKYDAQLRSVQESSSEALDLANRSVRVLEKFEDEKLALNAHVSEELERLSKKLQEMETSISSQKKDFTEKNRQIEVRLKPKVDANEALQNQLQARLAGLESKLEAIAQDHTDFKSEMGRMNSAYEDLRQKLVSLEGHRSFEVEGSFSEDSISPRHEVPNKFQSQGPHSWNQGESPSRATVRSDQFLRLPPIARRLPREMRSAYSVTQDANV
eukprot:753605-Hanusia_phi.AAC.6